MKKRNILFGALGTLGALYTGYNAFLYYEVMAKKAKIPGKIVHSSREKAGIVAIKDPKEEWTAAQDFKALEIEGIKGEKLRGWYLPAEKESNVYVVCSHGYRSHGRREFRFVSKYYHDKGYNLLLVDHQASGDSGGTFISFGYYESQNILKWLDYIKAEFNPDAEIIMHGVSMGCATVTMLADDERILPNVKFIVADCGFDTMKNQFVHCLKLLKTPVQPLMTTTNWANKLAQNFYYEDVRPIDHVKNAVVPMLFVHGGADTFVPTHMGRELYDACTSEKDLLIVEGASHAASYQTDTEAYDKKLDEFAEKYL